jgi:hypothetical protein
MAKHLRQGSGWRLGWDSEAVDFPGLVGGDDWAIELTQSEFQDFCRFSIQLSQTVAQISVELMDEEAIACEAASDLLWMEVRGFLQHYSLSFILLSGRRGEGQWTAEIVPSLLHAIQTLNAFIVCGDR